MIGPDQAWRSLNRANWDERVAVHLGAEDYELGALRAGRGGLNPIEEAELGPVDGLRVLHPQCHFGRDSLILAQRGAEVTGLDFSPPAIAAARELAAELDLAGRTRFVEADLYDAQAAIPEPGSFDLVFVTWGAINWLPDIRRWAEIVAWFVKPGGALYLAEAHPAALVLDDAAPRRATATCPAGSSRTSIVSHWCSTIRATTPTRRRACATPGPTNGSTRSARSSPPC